MISSPKNSSSFNCLAQNIPLFVVQFVDEKQKYNKLLLTGCIVGWVASLHSAAFQHAARSLPTVVLSFQNSQLSFRL